MASSKAEDQAQLHEFMASQLTGFRLRSMLGSLGGFHASVVHAYDCNPLILLENVEAHQQRLGRAFISPSFMILQVRKWLLAIAESALEAIELNSSSTQISGVMVCARDIQALDTCLKACIDVSRLSVVDPLAPGGLIDKVSPASAHPLNHS